ncbi:MAG: DNA repair protein RadC [Sphingobacteriia bacterium]|nr:DNA repair protein RadC [Sphingobacteriia bacterium]
MSYSQEKSTIREWAEDDRPREKLILKGANSLSDAELLAILIGTGTRHETAVDLAKSILAAFDNELQKLSRTDLKELMQIKGIGPAKGITILAALELGRRRLNKNNKEKVIINASNTAYDELAGQLIDLDYEQFMALFLNNRNEVIEKYVVSRGGRTSTVVDPVLLLRSAVLAKAKGIIIAHNHPSGNPQPSPSDITLTGRIKEASALFDIQLLDHLIITNNQYLSFADKGML